MGRHGRKRGGGVWKAALLVVALAAVVLLVRGIRDRGGAAQTSAPLATVEPTKPPETPAPTPEPTPTPWNLVLVNRSHPVPADWSVTLVELPSGQSIDQRIYAPLMEMFEAARSVNLDVLPIVESGYRSEAKQRELYEKKLSELMQQGYSEAGARAETDKWVTLPGTSEHQLGIAVDIAGAVYAIYPWLQEHSWEYGFVLRYPPDKTAVTGISGEEWHYRYVGKEAAAEMYEKGLCLEEYLETLN